MQFSCPKVEEEVFIKSVAVSQSKYNSPIKVKDM